MSEQNDAYSLYESGARELLNRVGQAHTFYRRALGYQQRLSENIKQSQLHGDTDEFRAERCRIINELNKLAMSVLGTSFSELCAQIEFTPGERLPHVRDPLRLARPGTGGPMQPLTDAIEARSHADYAQALCLCEDAVKRAGKCGDQVQLALACLYQADVQARNRRTEEGVGPAKRARRILEIRGDRHNAMVARLLTARFQQVSQDLDSARLEYLEALGLCRRLEAEAHEGASNTEAHLYRQIIEEIERVLEGIAVSKRSNARMIDYVTTGQFTIKGHSYHLYPFYKTQENLLELTPGAIHYVLPVPEDGWRDPVIRKEDYRLVQRKNQVIQEGPGFLLTGEADALWAAENWTGGQFRRETATGDIRPVPSEHRTIGRSDYPVALLKPMPYSEPLLILDRSYRFLVGFLQNIPGGSTGEIGLSQPPETDMSAIDVTVCAEGMAVLPHWVQTMKPSREQDSGLLEFRLLPREVGPKQIEVNFYYQRHWLTHIRFNAEVVGLDE